MPKESAHPRCQRSNAFDGSIEGVSQFRPINRLNHSLADHLSSGHRQNGPTDHERSRKRQKTRQAGSESEESHSVDKPTDLSRSPRPELILDESEGGSTMATARQRPHKVAACGLGTLNPQNLEDTREILHGVQPESVDALLAATVRGIRGDPQIMLAPPEQSAGLDNRTDHNFYNAPYWQDTNSVWDAFLVQEESCSLE